MRSVPCLDDERGGEMGEGCKRAEETEEGSLAEFWEKGSAALCIRPTWKEQWRVKPGNKEGSTEKQGRSLLRRIDADGKREESKTRKLGWRDRRGRRR